MGTSLCVFSPLAVFGDDADDVAFQVLAASSDAGSFADALEEFAADPEPDFMFVCWASHLDFSPPQLSCGIFVLSYSLFFLVGKLRLAVFGYIIWCVRA